MGCSPAGHRIGRGSPFSFFAPYALSNTYYFLFRLIHTACCRKAFGTVNQSYCYIKKPDSVNAKSASITAAIPYTSGPLTFCGIARYAFSNSG